MVSSSLIAAVAVVGLYPLQVAAACEEMQNVLITHYGYPDNDPPGPAVANQCGDRGKAGGTGTADDPITFATADDEFEDCSLVYVPMYQKYFYKGDSCARCQEDWGSKKWHIDLWTGSPDINGGDAQIDCENTLPGGEQLVIRDPPTDLPVNTDPLFADQTCHPELVFDVHPGSYCGGGGGGSTTTTTGHVTTSSTTTRSTYSATTLLSLPVLTVSHSTPTPISGTGQHHCSWLGHCIGDPCEDYNDCADPYVCKNGVCAAYSFGLDDGAGVPM